MKFSIEELRPTRNGMTISRDSKLGNSTKVTYFSMGKDTSISQESYDRMTMYIGASGWGEFIIGEEPKTIKLQPDELLIVPAGTLCGMQTSNGIVYTEIICTGKDINMNANVKTNEVFALKNLISYEEDRAPGNAIVFALEGEATIGYEGKDYELSEGECFRFEKNGLHSVTANGKFKMALLLVLE